MATFLKPSSESIALPAHRPSTVQYLKLSTNDIAFPKHWPSTGKSSTVSSGQTDKENKLRQTQTDLQSYMHQMR